MAGGLFSTAKLHAMTIRESANDGSDFTNPDADYRRLFLGEDGELHLKDSSGTVTDVGGSGTAREDLAAVWLVASTKTNIGTSYVDVYTDTNIQGNANNIDTTGKTQVRVVVIWDKVGAGTQALKVCNQSNEAEILHEFTNLSSGGNDSGLVSIDAAFTNEVVAFKLMAKSTTAGDDPVFRACRIYVK